MTKTFGDITHPDDLEADWKQTRLLLAGEIENYSMEKRYYRKDGSIVWVNLTRFPDAQGGRFARLLHFRCRGHLRAQAGRREAARKGGAAVVWHRGQPGWASSSGTCRPTAPSGRTSGCTKSSVIPAPTARSARRS